MDYNGILLNEEPEKSEYSCVGCVFSIETYRIVNSKKISESIFAQVGENRYGCHAPDTEPYKSCKARHVRFTSPGKEDMIRNVLVAKLQRPRC